MRTLIPLSPDLGNSEIGVLLDAQGEPGAAVAAPCGSIDKLVATHLDLQAEVFRLQAQGVGCQMVSAQLEAKSSLSFLRAALTACRCETALQDREGASDASA